MQRVVEEEVVRARHRQRADCRAGHTGQRGRREHGMGREGRRKGVGEIGGEGTYSRSVTWSR